MQDWLYGEDGYYSTFKQIGKKGDFYTSVSSSRFFGGTIGAYIVSLVENDTLKPPFTICEIGAHNGYLIADIIEFIYTLKPEILKDLKVLIVEPFEENQKIQKEYFYNKFGDDIVLFHEKSLKEIDDKRAFVVANEIFDAFSCDIYDSKKIAFLDNEQLYFENAPNEYNLLALKYGFEKTEIPVGVKEFAIDLYNAFGSLIFLTFDYGEWEFQNRHTFRSYKDHKVFSLYEIDFKNFYKNSDLTYDVAFRYINDLFCENGFEQSMFLNQNRALLNMGIDKLLKILEENVPYEIYLREVSTIKTLLNPSLLGERFKAIEFRKLKI